MTDQRFERQLPTLLEDLYLGPTPTYRDEVMATAVGSRQRPPWTFPGRWLPMADIASRPAFAPRVPKRTVGVAFVIAKLGRGRRLRAMMCSLAAAVILVGILLLTLLGS